MQEPVSQLSGVPAGTDLQILVTLPNELEFSFDTVEYRKESIGSGAATGGLTGAAIGIGCGPFAYICIPLLYASGAVAGGLAGELYQGITNVSRSARAKLEASIEAAVASMDCAQIMERSVYAAVGSHWNVVEEGGDFTFNFQLSELVFLRKGQNVIAPALAGTLVVTREGANGPEAVYRKDFQAEGAIREPQVYLAEDGNAVAVQIPRLIEVLAGRMVRDLMYI